MNLIEDPNPTLVTPTPLNLTRPGTPGIEKSIGTEIEARNGYTKLWIQCGRPFRGIIRDIRTRLPFYISDWTDAYNYRVIPATAMIFFAK
jgi:boron transporter